MQGSPNVQSQVLRLTFPGTDAPRRTREIKP
jgi:hypothetical protein